MVASESSNGADDTAPPLTDEVAPTVAEARDGIIDLPPLTEANGPSALNTLFDAYWADDADDGPDALRGAGCDVVGDADGSVEATGGSER